VFGPDELHLTKRRTSRENKDKVLYHSFFKNLQLLPYSLTTNHFFLPNGYLRIRNAWLAPNTSLSSSKVVILARVMSQKSENK